MARNNTHDHGLWTHDHHFLGHGHEHAERRARAATLLTAIFMIVEITAGLWFGSMALLADGVHMATHVGALGLAAAAYWLARRHAGNERFSFGSGKFGDLAAFASAIVLGLIALSVAAESMVRLFSPIAINYRSALPIAAIGLLVNLASAFILKDDHHGHQHAPDHNLRAAYVHVLADAATSLLAIGALAAGLLLGLRWLDPTVGLIGAGVIASWSFGLIRDSGMVLLDAETDPQLAQHIRTLVESDFGARVADLHLWRVGPGHHSLIVSLICPGAVTAEEVKARLRERHPDLSHVTVEVAVCADCPP
ncbi:MAG: cation diffusion facilitator family transporter [Alphaproteobacteria bacterium]|jgi:cation diffusion facilitator family transporter